MSVPAWFSIFIRKPSKTGFTLGQNAREGESGVVIVKGDAGK